MEKVAEICNCNVDSVRKILKQRNIDIISSKEIAKRQQSIMVNQYDLNDNYIQTFNSYSDAARWLQEKGKASGNLAGIISHIGAVIKGKRKSAYKYHWKITN